MENYHLIGVKGSGMSALAQILHDLGNNVQGEDIDSFLFTQVPLETRNIPLFNFGDAPLTIDMKVIASNAFEDTHPSILRCKELGIHIYRYHHFIGDWMKRYTSIAVTGSHGKTTTTGMMTHTLNAIEPVCSLIGDGTGEGAPNARLFVFEGCEYRRHFLAYEPQITVITNIDFDHPDYFSDINDVRDAFNEMASLSKKRLVVCGDDPQIRLLKLTTDVLYYGFEIDNDLRAANLVVESDGITFDVYFKDIRINGFSIPLFGKHNVLNALAVIGVALELDYDINIIKKQLATFSGVKRRFTERQWGSNVIIDDYAHHPVEIKATLEATRSKYPKKRIIGIFQPHTFSRMEKLIDDFAFSLKDADEVYLCQIFNSAREATGTITINDLQLRIPGSQLVSERNFKSQMSPYDDSVLVFMGAGDIQKYQEVLFQS
ncbi:UDP-N-acetylmuramate--L-alanine ligase [Paenibacillus glycinis]|uniref:UDP-N-acetylmuramate--L-alanine ligase n=1 Tax=Paenibacillus glycinis TaxID=2697035 RepID=A0ABW9XS90_9BACL|nr:UDP-N-acetylmuramate--L-alanine ligase [Paenibacillus glycinis]NBD25523.1 UDP-N-acetylmuramate--L-alanine ligase [Paenibacillus glycinis]